MKSKIIQCIVYIALSVVIMYVAFQSIRKQHGREPDLIKPVAQAVFTSPSPTQPPKSALKNVVDHLLEGDSDSYGVVVKNLKTGESYYNNEQKSFEPASLYKLWIMVAAFHQIEAGELQEDDVLSQDATTLNNQFNITSEAAELSDGTIILSVKDALEQMITISDNYAALLLSEQVQLSNVDAFLREHDFTKSSLGEPPQTTAFDVALFFEKLYRGALANPEDTQKMIALLKRQTLNNKLPKYLSNNVPIAHKTGELDLFTHDAGIVFSKQGDYIIVVLSETNSPADAEERIAVISKAVYDYFGKSS